MAEASSESSASTRGVERNESDGCERHSPGQVFGRNSGEIQCRPLSGDCGFGGRTVDLHSTNAHALARGKYFQLFFFANRSSDQGSGDDCSEAFHGEDAIYRETGKGG